MPEFTKAAYIRKVLPHLLPKIARSLGITPNNKDEWQKIAFEVREHLSQKYDTAPDEELQRDVQFNKKKIGHRPSDAQYELNDEVIDRLEIAESKKSWFYRTRNAQLDSASTSESKLAEMLAKVGVKVYQKPPIKIHTDIFFPDLFLPDHNLVIEVNSKTNNFKKLAWTVKRRFAKMREAGYNVRLMSNAQVDELKSNSNLLQQILHFKSAQKSLIYAD